MTTEARATQDLPAVFNPLEAGYTEWPYDQYRRLRDNDPIHRSDLVHGWVITRFDDVNTVLRDASVSSNIENATPTPITEAEQERSEAKGRGSKTVVLLDDPDHARLRKLLAPPFKARAVEDVREMIERRVSQAVDSLRAEFGSDAEFDLIGDFAYPLPVEIFCEMLGVPDEDHPKFRHWTMCVARNLDPVMSDEERAVCQQGVDEMWEYLEDQANRKRAEPTDDLMSTLVHAEDGGDTMNHQELMGQLMTLYVAGHEPTAGLVGNGMLGLFRHPDQLDRLTGNPDAVDADLLRNAISELLRFDGPNQFVRRVATQEMRIGDTPISAGDVMYLSPGSANHDPRRWGDTADEVIVDRADAQAHMQFGAGIHSCLGMHLARLQIEVVLQAVFTQMRDLEIAGEPEWSTRMVIRSLNRLPVRCKL